jgi:Zn-dependent metalloprotease
VLFVLRSDKSKKGVCFMCQRETYRHSIFCVLPPYILQSIAQNGSSQQRSRALQHLGTDHTIRTLRTTYNLISTTQPRGPIAPTAEGHPQRTIYNAHQTTNLPGDVARAEGSDPTDDVVVNEAYDGLGATYDFYWNVYQRNSIDDEGLKLDATVHYDVDYDNAFWNGEAMIFGDGDGELFNRFTISLDIIGHELTHGVTQDEAQLIYMYQSGALNESISDIFGSLVKQFKLQQTADQADWLIGQGLFTSKVEGVALRSMKAPGTAYDDPLLGKDPQPMHMRNFVNTSQDNGGVHINSGIPNHTFYLVATKLGGHAWEKPGRIWYETLRDPRLRSNASFSAFARLTVANADRLYGHNSPEQQAVIEAWKKVGVRVS